MLGLTQREIIFPSQPTLHTPPRPNPPIEPISAAQRETDPRRPAAAHKMDHYLRLNRSTGTARLEPRQRITGKSARLTLFSPCRRDSRAARHGTAPCVRGPRAETGDLHACLAFAFDFALEAKVEGGGRRVARQGDNWRRDHEAPGTPFFTSPNRIRANKVISRRRRRRRRQPPLHEAH